MAHPNFFHTSIALHLIALSPTSPSHIFYIQIFLIARYIQPFNAFNHKIVHIKNQHLAENYTCDSFAHMAQEGALFPKQDLKKKEKKKCGELFDIITLEMVIQPTITFKWCN